MSNNSPCASCKLLRKRCTENCIFAPFFPSDDLHKFAIVHKIFGASNVSKMLQDLPVNQRADAVSSLVYEATARIRDPVHGCLGAISYLENQVSQLQMQLKVARAEILCIQMQQQQEPPSVSAHFPTQQILEGDDHDDHKSYRNLALTNNLTATMTFASPSNVGEEPLKRESLWT